MRNPRFALFVRHVDLGYWRFTGSYRWISQAFMEGRLAIRNESDKFYVFDMEARVVIGDENGLDNQAWEKSKDIEQ